jgi:hypothetical protein
MEERARISTTLVEAFVGSAHGDLARVQALLSQEPRLINAAWDWGSGDWETGLGAAAHMGRADIASFLLESGAHLDIFAAAMLGKIEIVTAIIAAFPDAAQARGPHGIPLLDHARAGGPQAEAVAAYLQSLSSQRETAAR